MREHRQECWNVMGDIFYTAAILRERADLREQHATRIQFQHLASRYHGRPVRSMGTVLQVESTSGNEDAEDVLITASDDSTGEEVRFRVGAQLLAQLSAGRDRSQFARWRKGQQVVVEGRLWWEDAEAVPVVDVTAVRYA